MNIQQLTPEQFRQKIAGASDPIRRMDEFEQTSLKEETIKFISILPEVFSDDLDRMTLWERIGNGLIVALQKASGDFEIFINECLEYIKANHSKVAANENLKMFLETALSRPKEWREQFLNIIEKKHFLLIVHARTKWNINKGDK